MSRPPAGPDPLVEAPQPAVAPELKELLYLRQFFYQCPAGLFETDDAGIVQMVNPAAVRLLAPVIGSGDLSQLFPLLSQVAPEMVDVIAKDPDRLGPLAAGRRMLIPAGADQDACLEMQAVRVAPNRVMIVVQDVSAERRLAIREHETAVELQLAMLGHADEIPGLGVGVTYRAAAAELQVGGDWYDAIGLDDGRAVLVVGDAVGHNLGATTAMGQLRSAIRATAPYAPDPAILLGRADVIAGQISGAECATVACARLDPATGELSYAGAGHPPILVVRADGATSYLAGGRGLPLGVARTPRTSAATRLAPGDLMIMFTDGLYERRAESPDVGLARLAKLAAEARALPPTELSQALADGMLDGTEPGDDICVLVAAPGFRA
jgi:serine phosphatase RsbU (regulator of sigma subunit)